jgi:hypothetical protein
MLKGGEEREGGGYRQLEKRRKLAEQAKLKTSSLAQYMVLKPPPLDTPPPNKVMSLLRSLRSLGFLRLGYFRALWL